MTETSKKQLLPRIRRIEGQMRGIERMIESDKYCIDIINQINAAKRALERTALLIIQQHMKTCVTEAVNKKKSNAKIDELMKSLDHFLR